MPTDLDASLFRNVDRNSAAPAYAQVRDHLRNLIQTGGLSGQLPSERALAESYGVSYMTARRAIGDLVGEGMISRELGRGTFVRERFPRTVAPGHIGIIIPAKIRMGAANPHFAQIIQGVAEEGRRLGYRQTAIAEHPDDLLGRGPEPSVAGMVAVAHSEADLARLSSARARVPIVCIDSAHGDERIPNITCDNRAGSRLAAEHLVRLGHRRIGYISGNRPGEVTEARFDGYVDALTAGGIAIDPQLVVEGDFETESGYAGAARLLGLPNPPTAIACANDAIAFGVYRRAHEMQLRMPDQFSIVGFDDIAASGLVTPGLTTIAVPRLELGWIALQTLSMMIAGGAPPARRVLPIGLVARQSSGPAPR